MLVALGQHARFDAEMRSGLSSAEHQLNAKFMKMKRRELSTHDSNGSTLIQQPFAKIHQSMVNTQLYKSLLELPKGAILHVHWDSMLSADWLIKVASYNDHCWMDTRPGKGYGAMNFSLSRPGEGFQLLSKLRDAAPHVVSAFDDSLVQLLSSSPTKFEPWKNAWIRFQKYFGVVNGLVSYVPVFEQYLRKAFQNLVSQSRLVHVELRFDVNPVMYNLNGTSLSPHETLAVLQRVAKEFASHLTVRLILSSYKPAAPPAKLPAILRQAADLAAAFPNLVVGFDMVGQEDISPSLHDYAPALVAGRKEHGLKYFLHAGETAFNGNDTAAENVIDAALLARRIGHGLALIKRPELGPHLRQQGIAIECCPISNQVLGYVQDFQNHPAAWMVESGVPLTLSPDDPGALGYDNVAADWWVAFVAWNMDLASLKQLAHNSIKYSALEDAEKEVAFTQWRKQWDSFVHLQLIALSFSTSDLGAPAVVV